MLRVLMAVAVALAVGTPSSSVRADLADGLAAFDAGDYAQAAAEFQPLAESGDAEAQLALADLYRNGLGVPADQAAATAWYRRAAEQGVAVAQLNLGEAYHKGLGVARDPVQAYLWFALAAKQGRKWAEDRRVELSKQLNSAQLEEAERLIAAWRPRKKVC
ncbi:MAG: tetratricopeptide repeat protein [Pseudomonadota bacterium]